MNVHNRKIQRVTLDQPGAVCKRILTALRAVENPRSGYLLLNPSRVSDRSKGSANARRVVNYLPQWPVLVEIEQFGAKHIIVFCHNQVQLHTVEVVLCNHIIDGRNGAIRKANFGGMKRLSKILDLRQQEFIGCIVGIHVYKILDDGLS